MTNHHTDAPPPGQPGGTEPPVPWEGGLPDLTDIDLETLRAMDHPALSEVLAALVRRTLEPAGVLCQFQNSV